MAYKIPRKQTNKKCLKCTQICKQYEWLDIIVCPNFEAKAKKG